MKRCNHPRCHRLVEVHLWGCYRHWHRLPAYIREAIKMDAAGGNTMAQAYLAQRQSSSTTKGVRPHGHPTVTSQSRRSVRHRR